MGSSRPAFDVVIVGAGSAGCVLAARLSEDLSRTVLLIEAGPHYAAPASLPSELWRMGSYAAAQPGSRHNWSYRGIVHSDVVRHVPRGRVVGGSSAINRANFQRGTPEDFAACAAVGNDLWSWEQVLPRYRAIETDMDFVAPWHGFDGPVAVRRPREVDFCAPTRAFVTACRDAGYPDDPDKNAPTALGVGPAPLNVDADGRRLSMAVAWLAPALGRPNLTVRGDTHVRRVLFEGRRAVGVEVAVRGRREVVRGERIVLSAGAINSPQLLLLSGVGPADELRALGIDVVHDSPRVGREFMDDPIVSVSYRARVPRPPTDTLIFQAGLNYTATGSDVCGDMELCAAAYPHDRPVAAAREAGELIIACVLQQEESRGAIELVSADPETLPRLHYRYLSESADRARLRDGVRLIARLLEHQAFAELAVERTTPTDAELDSDAALDAWLRAHVTTTIHTACSARMGPGRDPGAVVDQRCRVHGVDGLFVVDTSVMPRLVRRGPGATVVMMAERASEFLTQ